MPWRDWFKRNRQDSNALPEGLENPHTSGQIISALKAVGFGHKLTFYVNRPNDETLFGANLALKLHCMLTCNWFKTSDPNIVRVEITKHDR